MGKFEKNIKKKLDEGELKFNPDHWAQLNEKLNAPNQHTPFERKVKDIFNTSILTESTSNWDDMNDRLNHANPSNFNKKIKKILSDKNIAYSGVAWEVMREVLSNQSLTPFEAAVKSKFKNNEVAYNSKHWDSMNNRLNSKSKKHIAWWIWSGAAAIIILGGVFLSQLSGQNKTTFGHSENLNNSPNHTIESSINKSSNTYNNEINQPDKNNNVFRKTNKKNQITSTVNTKKLTPVKLMINENKIAVVLKPKKNKKEKFETISLKRKTGELFLNLESITKLPFYYNKPNRPQLHAAATLWLNFWDNPSVTGFYGKHQFSNQFVNTFETMKSEKTDFGKIDFIQPTQNTIGYEYQLGISGLSIGAYQKYQLKKNWNYNDLNISTSYNKNILPQLNIRIGASAILHKEQLAVNRLTLRERASYGDYIYTSKLGDSQAKTEEYISYNVGGFVNHPYFFVGYTAENIHQTFINKTEEEITTKHHFIAGAHLTLLKQLKASAMIKYAKKLTSTYSPSIGLTYKEKYFIVGEYNRLSRYDVSFGYNWNQVLRVLGSFGIKQKNNEDYQLNLDHFQERDGFMSLGVYFTIK